MKNLDISTINSLFQTNWHPNQGDFVKENSIKDGEVLQDQLKKHRIKVWFLWGTIIIVFITAMVVLSF
ncbi:MAG: hypothetical protein ABFS12_06695 [Bacteroidota bacterium]